jgi:hypothetical protein
MRRVPAEGTWPFPEGGRGLDGRPRRQGAWHLRGHGGVPCQAKCQAPCGAAGTAVRRRPGSVAVVCSSAPSSPRRSSSSSPLRRGAAGAGQRATRAADLPRPRGVRERPSARRERAWGRVVVANAGRGVGVARLGRRGLGPVARIAGSVRNGDHDPPPSTAAGSSSSSGSAVALDDAGRIAVAWKFDGPGPDDPYVDGTPDRVMASGGRLGRTGRAKILNGRGVTDVSGPLVALDGRGRMAVAWSDRRIGIAGGRSEGG